MSFIQKYFGKNPEELTYQDVVDFFSVEREESDKIEFKSYYSSAQENERDKENGVIRGVCGFLNSGGGLLIWGAPIGMTVQGRNEKIFTGSLSPVTRLVEKDYIINRITDSVTPAPNNITFFPLNDNGNYIYLFEVLASEYSPHQFKNTYYMRIDGQTKPAPHHYIEALFKKITYPRLKGFIKLEEFYLQGGIFYLKIKGIIFNFSRLQNETKLAYRMIVSLGATFENNIGFPHNRYFMNGHEMRVVKDPQTVYYNQPITFTEILQLDYNELLNNDSTFEMMLYFGGEKAPLQISNYKIKVDFRNLNPQNLNHFYNEIDENRYAFEHSDELGLSEEERLQMILGR